jgi:hypothetical protein
MVAFAECVQALRPPGGRAAPPRAHCRRGGRCYSPVVVVVKLRACMRASRRQPRARGSRCAAIGSAEPYDVARAPCEQSRLYFPDEVLRSALQLDASGETVPGTVLHCRRMKRLLQRHPLLQCSSADADAPRHDVASSPDVAAGAQQRLLRLLAALEAACPTILRGAAGAASTAEALAAPKNAQGVQHTLKHCFRRLDTLATFVAHVPESAWVHAPETWQPPACRKCVMHVDCIALRAWLTHLSTQADCAAAFVHPPRGGRALRGAAIPVRRVRAVAQRKRRLPRHAGCFCAHLPRRGARRQPQARCTCIRQILGRLTFAA